MRAEGAFFCVFYFNYTLKQNINYNYEKRAPKALKFLGFLVNTFMYCTHAF